MSTMKNMLLCAVAAAGPGVPAAILAPQLLALEAVAATLFLWVWMRVRFAPRAYEKPLWLVRLRLSWWGWRADRRALR